MELKNKRVEKKRKTQLGVTDSRIHIGIYSLAKLTLLSQTWESRISMHYGTTNIFNMHQATSDSTTDYLPVLSYAYTPVRKFDANNFYFLDETRQEHYDRKFGLQTRVVTFFPNFRARLRMYRVLRSSPLKLVE